MENTWDLTDQFHVALQIDAATPRHPNKQPSTLSIQPRTILVYAGKSRSHGC